MLCDNCSNKNICKYFTFLIKAPMIIEIKDCDNYICKNKLNEKEKPCIVQDDNMLKFKQPIDYSKFDIPNRPIMLNEEEYDEERITVDLSEDHSSKVVSISDILLGDKGEDE